jgi:hypothetical protein
MLVAVGFVRGNVCRRGYDRSHLGLGHQFSLVKLCLQISGDIVHIGPWLGA